MFLRCSYCGLVYTLGIFKARLGEEAYMGEQKKKSKWPLVAGLIAGLSAIVALITFKQMRTKKKGPTKP